MRSVDATFSIAEIEAQTFAGKRQLPEKAVHQKPRQKKNISPFIFIWTKRNPLKSLNKFFLFKPSECCNFNYKLPADHDARRA